MKSLRFNGLDEIDIIRIINNKKNAYLKLALDSIEREGFTAEEYREIRKIFLDNFNEFSRSVLRLFTGDVER